jgi:hypothetical protein
MADCNGCIRSRVKSEAHLAAEGYIECKACDDAGMLMQAFKQFAKERRSSAPFVVEAMPGHPGSAWPFQFQPESIARCDGYSRRE